MKLENKSFSQLVKEADKWFSLYIRQRDNLIRFGKCILCGNSLIEHCFHWVSRRHYSTRWNEFNAIGSCAGCNFNMMYDPAHFYLWLHNHRKGRLDRLVKLSRLTKVITREKLIKIIIKYKRRYNQIKNNT